MWSRTQHPKTAVREVLVTISNMTPLEAISKLYELHQKAKEGG
jgi:hypothetical protein